jgi:hypothetical protein
MVRYLDLFHYKGAGRHVTWNDFLIQVPYPGRRAFDARAGCYRIGVISFTGMPRINLTGMIYPSGVHYGTI